MTYTFNKKQISIQIPFLQLRSQKYKNAQKSAVYLLVWFSYDSFMFLPVFTNFFTHCNMLSFKILNIIKFGMFLPTDRISVHKRCLSLLMKVSLNIYTEEFEMFSNSARLCQHSKGEVEREETALRSGTASHGTHLQRL